MTENNTCEECSQPAKHFCSSCRAVFYCSRECQKKAWKSHKAKCKPIILKNHHIFGRHYVASRDLKEGEIILKESPIIVGPKQRTIPICLGCHKQTTGPYRCSKCRFPVCAPSCEISIYHKAECTVLAKLGGKLTFENLGQPNPIIGCIAPLRCLLTKTTDPKKWEQIFNLQSHFEDIKKTELYKFNQTNVVDIIRRNLEYTDAEEELIHRICGILIVNSFELKHNNQRVRGLFPQASMFAHNCTPNAKHSFDEDMNAIFRTTVAVPKGTPITITYTQTLWNTMSRRRHLQNTKFFVCTCKRCFDPSELGTEMSTLICSNCQGHIRSKDPLKDASPWMCDKCARMMRGSQILWGDNALQKEIKDMNKTTPTDMENFLKIYASALHPQHRFFIEVKYALCKFYGNYPGYSYSELSREQVHNKIEFCKQLLKLAETLDPGKSMFRGTLLFELQAANVAMAKILLSCEEITQDQCGDRMTESMKLLQEATEILKHEPEMEKGGLDERLTKLSKDLEL